MEPTDGNPPVGCPTCDQLSTLYEREKAKNSRLLKVVEAARKVVSEFPKIEENTCSVGGHKYLSPAGSHVDSKTMLALSKALSELEAGR